MSVQPANTHPLFDPSWGRASVEARYREACIVLSDVVRFGADLLLRGLKTGPTDPGHRLVLAVLFRQVLVSADGVERLLSGAAVDAEQVQFRAFMEARWGLLYALRDPAKWGLHLHVVSLRAERGWHRRFTPGTPEYDANAAYREMVAKKGGSYTPPPGTVPDRVAVIDARLAQPDCRQLNAGFDAASRGKRFDPAWYYDPAVPEKDRLKSIRQLALALGERGEYETLYGHASNFVHGGRAHIHLKADELGASLAPIRSPEGIRSQLLLTAAYLGECIRFVLERWRPDEMNMFVRKYVEEWNPTIAAAREIDLGTTPINLA